MRAWSNMNVMLIYITFISKSGNNTDCLMVQFLVTIPNLLFIRIVLIKYLVFSGFKRNIRCSVTLLM